MGIQKRLSVVGVAKQTGKGAPAANPTYQVGVDSGYVMDTPTTEADLDLTWTTRVIEGHDRTEVKPASEWGTVATPSIIGFLLFCALGADAVTGAGAPFSHSFTPFDDLPWVTMFGRYGSNYTSIADCKLDELELSWEKAGALKAKCKWLGITPSVLGAPFVATTTERIGTGYMDAAGGTFLIDAGAAVVTGGSVKFANHLDQVMASGAVVPNDVFPGKLDVDTSLKVVPDDVLAWRKYLTGAVGGAAPQTVPYYGALSLKWVMDANTDLTASGPRVKFLTRFPESSAAGGPAEITVEGKFAQPAAGAAVTALLRNAVAAY